MTSESILPQSRGRLCNLNAQETLFVTAVPNGFCVHVLDPLRSRLTRTIPGGVSIASLLDKSNILALITPEAPRELKLWNDTAKSVVLSINLATEDRLIGLKLRRNVIICVFLNQVRIYEFKGHISLLHTVATCQNHKGLLALSTGPTLTVVTPSTEPGYLRITHLGEIGGISDLTSPRSILISAHSRQISCLAMSRDERVVASASDSGTLIRLWDTQSGRQIDELRRGISGAIIHAMSFSNQDKDAHDEQDLKLAVISHKGTLHIFSIADLCHVIPNPGDLPESSINRPQQLRTMNPQSASRSIAKSKLIVQDLPRGEFAISWTSPKSLVVVHTSGRWWKYIVAKNHKTSRVECHLEATREWSASLETLIDDEL